jgi:hypothetical protein
MRRKTKTANASMAISPITGVEPNDTTWFMVPKIAELVMVPVITAAPPVMTVMNALAMYAPPDEGSKPVKGANTPPAKPDKAAPTVKVHI